MGRWVIRPSTGAKDEKGNIYHAAINEWEKEQKQPGIVLCFVQYKGISQDQRPRIYYKEFDKLVQEDALFVEGKSPPPTRNGER